ncbi:hypothetical protein G6F56_000386 [Rhizopus delemar]|nr:hypothetical protein G6F56_000386 [Rhizopus delemar]
MYSPQRGSKLRTPERDNAAPSPLRALSPFVDAIKSAQSKANRDFESFYGNLMSRLTPKTSASRIYKKTPETTQRTKSSIQHKRLEAEHNRTSLTPLFERHTLREEYPVQNPFYEDSGSETTDNVSEFDIIDDVSINTVKTEPKRRFNNGASSFIDRLKDESKRMEELQSSISAIKRQSSFLAEDFFSDDNNKELHIPAPPPVPVRKEKEMPKHSNTTFRTPQPAIANTYLTPPQSTDYYRLSTQPVSHKSPQSTSYRTVSVVDETNDKEDLLREISHAKLRSAEIIRTPGGTRTCNRFWKEIHGLNAKRELSLSPVNSGRIEKTRRTSTLNKRLWDDNDDAFWTAESSTAKNSSSFNQKLMRVKELEDKGKRVKQTPVEEEKKKQVKQTSLEEEIESANKREYKKGLPNPLFLEELKAKYRDKLLDDSDSYKFS